MVKIIVFMLMGLFCGWLFRRRRLKSVGYLISLLVYLLLFTLGLEIGSNDEIFYKLHALGLNAIVITLLSVFFSVLLAWLLYNWSTKSKEKNER